MISGSFSRIMCMRHDLVVEKYQAAYEKYKKNQTKLLNWIATNDWVKEQAKQNLVDTYFALKLYNKVHKMERKLSRIYYSPRCIWKGLAAGKKLAKEAGVCEDNTKLWLMTQAIWQIYLPSEAYPETKFWCWISKCSSSSRSFSFSWQSNRKVTESQQVHIDSCWCCKQIQGCRTSQLKGFFWGLQSISDNLQAWTTKMAKSSSGWS